MRNPNQEARLLAEFLESRDAEAFAALVARLGPSVLRICRTVLFDEHLAEDAFQATFLTLFRKADAIQDPEALRGWICGTAYKTAARLRERSIRLARRERAGCVDDAGEEFSPSNDHDVFLILRQELDSLPEKYRCPLVLCYLEGLTHEQAAARLGWATGTVKIRLVRGRKLLRERLDRRKVCLGVGLILLWRREAGAAAPGLEESTIRVAEAIEGPRTATPSGAEETPRADLDAASPAGFNWPTIRRAALMLLVAVAVAATAAGSMAPSAPPAEDPEAAELPANLKDVFQSDCS